MRAGDGFQQAGGGLRVVVLGGTGVVSQAVEDELAQFVRSDAPDLDDVQNVGEPDDTSFVVDPDPDPAPPPPPSPSPSPIHDADADADTDPEPIADADADADLDADADPIADTGPAEDAHTLTATVTDQYGDPFRDAGVRFVVDEEGAPDERTAAAGTNSDGRATFTFTNGTPGATNEITACTTGDSDAPADCDGEGVLSAEPATMAWGPARPYIKFPQSRSDDPNRVILIYSAPLNEPLAGAESQFTLDTGTMTVTATA